MAITTIRGRRATTLAGGLVLATVLAACSGGSGAEGPSTGAKNPSAAPQASSGPEIANPKDAAAVDVCSLLSSEAATTLGVKLEGEKDSNGLKSSLPDACTWESPDGGSSKISLTAIDGRSIQVYYRNQSTYVDFKKLTIAGYPAVRANRNDPMVGGSCSVFLATKKNQTVMSASRLNARDTGTVDPCMKAKKALGLSLPSWPAAK